MFYDYKNTNKYTKDGRFEELIRFSEQRIDMQFETLLKLIRAKDSDGRRENLTDILMVTGPSASGKTTTSNMLAKYLSEDGYNCTVISLDDYYYDVEVTQRKQIEKGLVPAGSDFNDFDYETIDAIDVEFFRQQMQEYTSGKSIVLPKFDFSIGKRVKGTRVVESTSKDMIILEGIHSFNPVLTENLEFDTSIKIYISPFDTYVSEYNGKKYTVEPHQIRFMRRAIRDTVHRGAPIGLTMDMWDGVRRGEKNYMEPLIQYADVFINTSYEYEIAYLKKKIFEILDKSSAEDKKRFAKIIQPESLYSFEGADGFEIPENSLFNEFYM
ncbi:MAG: hypothetical protein E7387_04535 [Ruminococcaceae bacterium]|nr:hypothetical protein [Oscillospiraceae bacterium]